MNQPVIPYCVGPITPLRSIKKLEITPSVLGGGKKFVLRVYEEFPPFFFPLPHFFGRGLHDAEFLFMEYEDFFFGRKVELIVSYLPPFPHKARGPLVPFLQWGAQFSPWRSSTSLPIFGAALFASVGFLGVPFFSIHFLSSEPHSCIFPFFPDKHPSPGVVPAPIDLVDGHNPIGTRSCGDWVPFSPFFLVSFFVSHSSHCMALTSPAFMVDTPHLRISPFGLHLSLSSPMSIQNDLNK